MVKWNSKRWAHFVDSGANSQPCVPIRSSDNHEESHEESHKSLCVARKSKCYPIVFPSVTISNPNAWQNWGERGNNTSNCVWHITSPKCQDPRTIQRDFRKFSKISTCLRYFVEMKCCGHIPQKAYPQSLRAKGQRDTSACPVPALN